MYTKKKYFYNALDMNIKSKDAGCGVFCEILRLCDFIVICTLKRTSDETDWCFRRLVLCFMFLWNLLHVHTVPLLLDLRGDEAYVHCIIEYLCSWTKTSDFKSETEEMT